MKETERDVIQRTISLYDSFSRIYDPNLSQGQVSEILECEIAL